MLRSKNGPDRSISKGRVAVLAVLPCACCLYNLYSYLLCFWSEEPQVQAGGKLLTKPNYPFLPKIMVWVAITKPAYKRLYEQETFPAAGQ